MVLPVTNMDEGARIHDTTPTRQDTEETRTPTESDRTPQELGTASDADTTNNHGTDDDSITTESIGIDDEENNDDEQSGDNTGEGEHSMTLRPRRPIDYRAFHTKGARQLVQRVKKIKSKIKRNLR